MNEVLFKYTPGKQDSRAIEMGGDVLVVKFKTPKEKPLGPMNIGGSGGSIAATKEGDVQADIEGVLSFSPGDFDHPVTPKATTVPAQTISLNFGKVAVELKGDTVYYFNMRGGVPGFVARVSLSAR